MADPPLMSGMPLLSPWHVMILAVLALLVFSRPWMR
jgi:hypothetical protein